MIPTEHQEQVAFCQWLDYKKLHYFAIPNGSNKSKAAQRAFKAEGLKSGVPDMVCLLPNKIIFVEMKRRKGGTVSPEQKEWNKILNGFEYAEAHICKGFEEARAVIEQHLRG